MVTSGEGEFAAVDRHMERSINRGIDQGLIVFCILESSLLFENADFYPDKILFFSLSLSPRGEERGWGWKQQ